MPSYRCSIHIVDVRPGHAPDEVMAAAVAGVERHHLVEASQLDLVRGMPIVRVRYLVESASQSAEDTEAHGGGGRPGAGRRRGGGARRGAGDPAPRGTLVPRHPCRSRSFTYFSGSLSFGVTPVAALSDS